MAIIGENTFDITFDYTFQGIELINPPPSVDICRQRGAYLTWLSRKGWMFWLFSGKVSTGTIVTSLGSIKQARLVQDTQKEDTDQLVIRTAKLTYEQALAVSTVYKSIRAYLIVITDNSTKYVPVRIEPGTFPIWETGQSRGELEVTITLTGTGSQRL